MYSTTTQRGSALIISLVILLVMTMIGVQSMQSTTIEEKMAGNFRDRALAFEAAEAALMAGEVWLNLQTQQPEASTTGADGVWAIGVADLASTSTWSAYGVNAGGGLSIGEGGLYAAPQFLIEERTPSGFSGPSGSKEVAPGASAEDGTNEQNSSGPEKVKYRITARGAGSNPTTVVYLQSTYEKIYVDDVSGY